MAVIQVRDVPEHLYERIKDEARRERRSIAQQVVMVLARGLEMDVNPVERRKAILRRIASRAPITGKILDPVKLIRESRDA